MVARTMVVVTVRSRLSQIAAINREQRLGQTGGGKWPWLPEL